MPEISLGGQNVPYVIRRSRRARKISLRIDAQNGLQVVIPEKLRRLPDVERLLYERADWILKHLKRIHGRASSSVQERQFVSGETLLYLGVTRRLDISFGGRRGYVSVQIKGNDIAIRLPADVGENEQAFLARRALRDWMRVQAQAYIPGRVAAIARQGNFEYRRIAIRDQKTRWGSCSSLGNLNFNQRLMMMPPEAIDYVIIHELCHLRELNHSPVFWLLVARYCPDYRRWKRWIKDHQSELRF